MRFDKVDNFFYDKHNAFGYGGVRDLTVFLKDFLFERWKRFVTAKLNQTKKSSLPRTEDVDDFVAKKIKYYIDEAVVLLSEPKIDKAQDLFTTNKQMIVSGNMKITFDVGVPDIIYLKKFVESSFTTGPIPSANIYINHKENNHFSVYIETSFAGIPKTDFVDFINREERDCIYSIKNTIDKANQQMNEAKEQLRSFVTNIVTERCLERDRSADLFNE